MLPVTQQPGKHGNGRKGETLSARQRLLVHLASILGSKRVLLFSAVLSISLIAFSTLIHNKHHRTSIAGQTHHFFHWRRVGSNTITDEFGATVKKQMGIKGILNRISQPDFVSDSQEGALAVQARLRDDSLGLGQDYDPWVKGEEFERMRRQERRAAKEALVYPDVPSDSCSGFPVLQDLSRELDDPNGFCKRNSAKSGSNLVCFRDPSSYCKLHVVVSRFDEDVAWVENLGYRVFVMEKMRQERAGAAQDDMTEEPQGNQVTVVRGLPNKGDEATSYFEYIVAHYDSLPDFVAFVHGHYASFHSSPLGYKLRCLCIDPSTSYVSLNDEPSIIRDGSINNLRCITHPHNYQSTWFRRERITAYWTVQKSWDALFSEELGAMPPLLWSDCAGCGQFLASREAIRRHPKAFYERLIRLGTGEQPWPDEVKDVHFAQVMGYMYRTIFGANNEREATPALMKKYC